MIESARWIPGNQPVPLDADAPPALVLSGSAVVFAVDKETGARRPLFCVDPGEPLLPLPCPPEATWTVVAVPLESSGLELGQDTREWAAVMALENWLAKIGEAFGTLRESGAVRLIHAPEKIALGTGERAGIDQGLTFVRIGAGGGLLAGARVAEGTVVALVPGLWLEAAGGAQGDGGWEALEDPPDEAREILAATVDLMVPVFIEALDEAERRREEADRRRFAGRQEWDERVSAAALKALTSVAWPARRQTGPERQAPGNRAQDPLQDPLLEAMRAAAECLGVAVRPAQGPRRGGDQVREIADASRLRTRTVLLRGHWWRADNGPLVAFLEDGSPVALIPDRAGFFGRLRYRILDPITGTRLPVVPKSAGKLQSFGRMLYRSFPDDLSARGLIHYALAGKRGEVRTIAIAGFGAAALSLAAPAGVAILIGQAIPDGDRGMVWQLAAGMAAAAFGSALFLLTQAVATMRVQIAGFTSLQTGIWDYLLKLGPSYFRGFTAGQLHLRADAVLRIHQLLSADALRSLFAGASAVLTLALMFWFSPGLGLIALVSGALLAAGAWFGTRSLYARQERWQDLEEELSGLVLQAVQAVSKLHVAGAAGRAFSYWAGAYSRKQRLSVSIHRIRDRIRILNTVMLPAASAFGFLYLLSHPMPLAAFLAANAALTVFLTAVVSGSDTCANLSLAANLWGRMRSILAAQPEVDGAKTHPGVLRGAMVAENLTFRYRADGPLVLDNVSVRAAPGECIALTGPSGSGKSTLLNLILRFETPHSGAIYLDGREVSSLDIAAVRRQIGVVTQDARILAGSVFENICCGGIRSMEQAWEAARAAGLAEDIESMPMGMYTVVSEGGGNLSGGQRQRLLIARALVLKPSILIFDEATSALDNRTQAIVTESLRRLKATRILVAHRLSTIRSADRIYVIEKGRVVQQGTYHELISQPGLFARLASRQTV